MQPDFDGNKSSPRQFSFALSLASLNDHCLLVSIIVNIEILSPYFSLIFGFTHMLLDESPLILLTSALSNSLKLWTVPLHLSNLQLSGGAPLSQILRAGHRDTAFPSSASSKLVEFRLSGER